MTLMVGILLTVLCSIRIATAGVQLDGTSGYIDMGTSSTYNFNNTTFTVIGFFSSANDDGYIFGKRSIVAGSPDAGGYIFRINADGTGTARLITNDNVSAGNRNTVSTTLKDGNLHCIAVVYTTNTTTLASNDVAIYYDGALDQGSRSDSGGGPYFAGTTRLGFGASSDIESTTTLAGTVENFSVYSGALSAENIIRYCSGKVRYGGYAFPGLVSYWPFDDCAEGVSGTGVTFNDRSKLGSNGVGAGTCTCKMNTGIGYAVGAD